MTEEDARSVNHVQSLIPSIVALLVLSTIRYVMGFEVAVMAGLVIVIYELTYDA